MPNPDNWLDLLKAEYPKRSKGKAYGWPEAVIRLEGGLIKRFGFEAILQGTKDYCAASKLSGDYGTEFIKMASTFYGKQLCFLDEYELEDAIPEVVYRRPEELSPAQKRIDADKAILQMDNYRSKK